MKRIIEEQKKRQRKICLTKGDFEKLITILFPEANMNREIWVGEYDFITKDNYPLIQISYESCDGQDRFVEDGSIEDVLNKLYSKELRKELEKHGTE